MVIARVIFFGSERFLYFFIKTFGFSKSFSYLCKQRCQLPRSELYFIMKCYLVYDLDYRLFEVFQNKPKLDKDMGWYAEGWHECVSARDVPVETQKVLAEVGMLEVFISVSVLFHTSKNCSLVEKGDKPCS